MGRERVERPPRRAGASTRTRRLVLGALVVLALFQLAVLLYQVVQVVRFPFDLDYGEGYVLNDAVRLARGEPIYVDLQRFPMVRSPYPPLFPALWSLLVPLAGPLFWPGRLLAALSLLGICILVAWNAGRARQAFQRAGGRGGVDELSRWVVLAAPAAVAASPFVYQWAGLARVDTLAISLAVAAVLVAQWAPGARGTAVAAVLCGLALWTRQTSIAAPLAIAIAIAFRSRRPAAGFAALVSVPTLLAGLILERVSAGQFARHVFLGNSLNAFNVPRLAVLDLVFVAVHLPLLVGALWWSLRALRREASPISLYVPLATLTILSAGNEGSSANYFLEPVVAAALALPFAWHAVQAATIATGSGAATATGAPLAGPSGLGPAASGTSASPSTAATSIQPRLPFGGLAPHLAPLLAAVYLATLLHWPNGPAALGSLVAPLGRTPTARDEAAGAAVDALVRSERRPVLVEAAGYAVRNGLPVWVQPIDLRAEQALGRWNSRRLIDALASGQFGLVVKSYDLLPRDVDEALREHFTLERRIVGDNGLTYEVYRNGS